MIPSITSWPRYVVKCFQYRYCCLWLSPLWLIRVQWLLTLDLQESWPYRCVLPMYRRRGLILVEVEQLYFTSKCLLSNKLGCDWQFSKIGLYNFEFVDNFCLGPMAEWVTRNNPLEVSLRHRDEVNPSLQALSKTFIELAEKASKFPSVRYLELLEEWYRLSGGVPVTSPLQEGLQISGKVFALYENWTDDLLVSFLVGGYIIARKNDHKRLKHNNY